MNELCGYTIKKYISLCLGFAVGFVQPAVLARFLDEQNFSYMIVIYGLLSYLFFVDLGMAQPIYTKIRESKIANQDWKEAALESIETFNTLALLVAVVVTAYVYGISLWVQNTIPVWTFMALGITWALNTWINNVESIYNGLGEYSRYPLVDITRKVINIVSFFMASFDSTLFTTFAFAVVALLLLSVCVLSQFRGMVGTTKIPTFLDATRFLSSYKKYYDKGSKDMLISTGAEVASYQGGYLLIPILLSQTDVVEYGLWMRLLLGIFLAMCVIPNSIIHKITENFFLCKYHVAGHFFKMSLVGSVTVIVVAIGVLGLFFTRFVETWVSGAYRLPQELLWPMGIWLFAKALHHVCGTFLAGVGQGIQFLMRTNVLVALILVPSMIIVLQETHSLNLALILSGIIYLTGAFVLLARCGTLLHTNEHASSL